jgi:hypothetical protein
MRWRESGVERFLLVQIPIEIRLSLRQGTVYYMAERGLSSVEPHYFVVLNQNPLGSKILLLLVASSQVEKAQKRISRKNLPPESLVVMDEAEYDDFSKDSCIDCNKLFNKSLEELCEQWRKKEVRAHKDLPRDLVERLIEGVKASPLISEDDQVLISF